MDFAVIRKYEFCKSCNFVNYFDVKMLKSLHQTTDKSKIIINKVYKRPELKKKILVSKFTDQIEEL